MTLDTHRDTDREEKVLALARRFGRRDGIHVTDLTLCLTKAWGQKRLAAEEIPYSPELALLFLVGQGQHQVLKAGGAQERVVEKGGIVGTIDEWDGIPWEKKGTRLSAIPALCGESMFERMPHWMEQVKSYCWLTDRTEAGLIVLFINGTYGANRCPECGGWASRMEEVKRVNPATNRQRRYCPKCPSQPFFEPTDQSPILTIERVTFKEGDVEVWGKVLVSRKKTLEDALADETMPDPNQFCYHNWLCQRCEVGPVIGCPLAGAGSLTATGEEVPEE